MRVQPEPQVGPNNIIIIESFYRIPLSMKPAQNLSTICVYFWKNPGTPAAHTSRLTTGTFDSLNSLEIESMSPSTVTPHPTTYKYR